MASLNKVFLIGNLTRDPEVRYSPKGTAVAEMSIAVNRVYNTDGGEKREEVTFVDITLWGRVAELAGQYLQKGKSVMVEGRLQLDTWEDKQTGQKRSKLKVVGENLQFLGSGKKEGDESGSHQESKPRTKQNRPTKGQDGKPFDDPIEQDGLDESDIPF